MRRKSRRINGIMQRKLEDIDKRIHYELMLLAEVPTAVHNAFCPWKHEAGLDFIQKMVTSWNTNVEKPI